MNAPIGSGVIRQIGMVAATTALGGAASAVWDKINILEDRLQPYLVERQPSVEEAKKEVDTSASKAVSEIHAHRKSLDAAAAKLDSIICRLDI